MNPHDLMKKAYADLEPSEGFTERVLAKATQQKRRSPRLIPGLIAAVLLLSCLSAAVYAVPELQHWLFGLVEVEERDRSRVEAGVGTMELDVDSGDYHLKYGAFLCVGRFLFTEVEITAETNQPISDQEIQEICNRIDRDQLVLTYVGDYEAGNHAADEEGWLKSFRRLDDGSLPGSARCTFYWTLARHDYDGTTLLVQLWEPLQWEPEGQGAGMVAQNEKTRRLLKETQIQRTAPEDEITLWMEDGMEVRVCSFGVELQGDGLWTLFNAHAADSAAAPDWGVILNDGTRIPFLNQPFGVAPTDPPGELLWSAAPFTASVDPGTVAALYCEDEVVPLSPNPPE